MLDNLKRFSNTWYGIFARVAVTLIALIAIFAFIDVEKTLSTLQKANYGWFGIAFLLLIMNSIQQGARWRGMLGRNDISLGKYVYFVFVGHFVGLFMPSQIASDAVKAMTFGKKYGDIGANVGVQVANRISGLIVIGLFSLTGLVLYWDRLLSSGALVDFQFRIDYSVIFAVGAVAALLLAALVVYKFRHVSWVRPSAQLFVNPKYLLSSLSFSFLIQLTSSVALFLQFKAVLPDPDLGMIIFFTSMAQVLLLLPLSIGGVGVREWVLVVLFSKIGGIPEDKILAVTILGYLNLIGLAALGGLWMSYRMIKERL